MFYTNTITSYTVYPGEMSGGYEKIDSLESVRVQLPRQQFWDQMKTEFLINQVLNYLS